MAKRWCALLLLLCVAVVGVECQQFPAIFIFGDSLTDSGNNNKLTTIAKANRLPYGRDFPTHQPTGRFCNGPLSTDYIASLAGLPFPPPYLSAGDNILQGVTFASASSGILNSSGDLFGQHVALSQQVTYFGYVKQMLVKKLGVEEAGLLISKSLFYVSIGSNDYLDNYLALGGVLKAPLQVQYSPTQFVELLQSNLEARIVELYSMGARKVAMVGLSVLGCIPFELFIRRSKGGKCIESINELTRGYNVALLERTQKLQSTYPHATFTYLNSYDFLNIIIKNPSAYGFENADTACCGSGPYHAIPCFKSVTAVCKDASKYVFWDFVHPTSALNEIVANNFWAGSPPDVNPFNLKQLAASP